MKSHITITWDMAALRLHRVKTLAVSRKNWGIIALVFSPNGMFLAIYGTGGQYRVYETEHWDMVQGGQLLAKCLIFNSTSDRIAAVLDDGSVTIRQVPGCRMVHTTCRHSALHCAYSPALLATISVSMAHMWSLDGTQLLAKCMTTSVARMCCFSADGDGLFMYGDRTLSVWPVHATPHSTAFGTKSHSVAVFPTHSRFFKMEEGFLMRVRDRTVSIHKLPPVSQLVSQRQAELVGSAAHDANNESSCLPTRHYTFAGDVNTGAVAAGLAMIGEIDTYYNETLWVMDLAAGETTHYRITALRCGATGSSIAVYSHRTRTITILRKWLCWPVVLLLVLAGSRRRHATPAMPPELWRSVLLR